MAHSDGRSAPLAIVRHIQPYWILNSRAALMTNVFETVLCAYT
jgi:hypothetical protein